MIIDSHAHLDPQLLDLERMTQKMDKAGVVSDVGVSQEDAIEQVGATVVTIPRIFVRRDSVLRPTL